MPHCGPHCEARVHEEEVPMHLRKEQTYVKRISGKLHFAEEYLVGQENVSSGRIQVDPHVLLVAELEIQLGKREMQKKIT